MPRSTREALEDALVADPDNFTLHCAYADLLMEEGDPRGQYIQMRLMVEDRNTPRESIRAIAYTAEILRQRHEEEWLGGLNKYDEIVW